MKIRKQPSLWLYMLGIAVLFLAGFLLLVVFGAQSYRETVDGQNDNMRRRTLTSYFHTAVRDYDTRGAVTVEDSAYGPVLVIADENSGYALRLYRMDTGKGSELVEDFAPLGEPLMPESAQVIGQTEVFAIEERGGGLVTVRTDAGSILLHIRCAEDDK